MNLRTVFMGSPDFALPVLRALYEGTSVVGVVTQPDRPAGRGKVLTPPPVKVLAEELGVEVIQPERLKHPDAFARLVEWAPDIIIVAAFGQILRTQVLELPKSGCINVHASLLPRWRGAAPIQAAILAGDAETGVTIMKMDAGIDTGDVLSQKAIEIRADDTASSLGERLADLGAGLLMETLPGYLSGEIRPVKQNPDLSTYAAMLKKEDGELRFSETAAQLERRVRASQPWPGAYFFYRNEPLKVLKASVENIDSLPEGRRGSLRGFPAIGTSEGAFILEEVQPAGKKSMLGDVFLRGARQWAAEGD